MFCSALSVAYLPWKLAWKGVKEGNKGATRETQIWRLCFSFTADDVASWRSCRSTRLLRPCRAVVASLQGFTSHLVTASLVPPPRASLLGLQHHVVPLPLTTPEVREDSFHHQKVLCLLFYLITFYLSLLVSLLDSSSSPCSSSPNSPVPQARPSSLHVLGRYTKAGRCKSTSSIPPSPLACIPPPQPLSPQCSPSCLLSHPKSLQGFHGKTLSPPTIARHSVRPRSAEPPRSPLLKRVQSAEKLTGDKTTGYHAERKAYSTRRHTMEGPLSEGEGLEDMEGDTATGFVCVGEHGRQGLYIGGPRGHQDTASGGSEHHRSSVSPQHRGGNHHSKEVVVMRKLALSERRDSFKKQEAVQEVCFDDLEEREAPRSPTIPVMQPKAFKASWINSAQAESGVKLEGKGSQGTTSQQKAKSKDKAGF